MTADGMEKRPFSLRSRLPGEGEGHSHRKPRGLLFAAACRTQPSSGELLALPEHPCLEPEARNRSQHSIYKRWMGERSFSSIIFAMSKELPQAFRDGPPRAGVVGVVTGPGDLEAFRRAVAQG